MVVSIILLLCSILVLVVQFMSQGS